MRFSHISQILNQFCCDFRSQACALRASRIDLACFHECSCSTIFLTQDWFSVLVMFLMAINSVASSASQGSLGGWRYLQFVRVLEQFMDYSKAPILLSLETRSISVSPVKKCRTALIPGLIFQTQKEFYAIFANIIQVTEVSHFITHHRFSQNACEIQLDILKDFEFKLKKQAFSYLSQSSSISPSGLYTLLLDITSLQIIGMSVPFIQIGQCGNQVGSNFYNIMFAEGCKASPAHQALLSQFFTTSQTRKDRPKAFQIDMEPKVVNKNLMIKRPWEYEKTMSLVQEEGSGNNWAYGCNVHGPAIKNSLEQMIRKFAEGEDYIKCFVQLQSMAGGTGSGLGTFILNTLGEMFEKTPKFVGCVMPHLSGEVILQSYNACMSLGTIYQQADGIFIVQNDDINQICMKQLKINKPALEDINEIIGRNLASVFFPVVDKGMAKVWSVEQNGFNYGVDLVESLFYDSRFKLCSIKTVPHGPKDSQHFNFDSWQAVQNQLLHKKKHISHSNLMIVRGSDHQAPLTTRVHCLQDRHAFYNYNRSATLLDNGPMFLQPLEKILERAYNMLKQNAYLYQYEKYSLQKSEMLECLAIIENVQLGYRKL